MLTGISKPTAGALASLSLFACLLSSCSPKGDVLARVGSRSITVHEFNEVARRVQGRYQGPPESSKARLLQDLIQRALLLEAAKAKGLERDPLARAQRQGVEAEVLSSTLVERMVPRPIAVSESEARQWYEWRNNQAHLQIIYAPDRTRADAALTELSHGADFGRIADRYSLSGTVPPGGDLGMISPGSLVAPLDRYLREAPIGKTIGPIQAPGEGWFLLRVIERTPRVQEPFEQQLPSLMEMLRQRKQRLLSVRAFQKLRDQYRVRVEPEGPHVLFARYNGFGGDPPEPSATEMARALARYDDGTGRTLDYTLRDALKDLERGGERPNATMLSSFQQWLESRAVQRAVEIEAERRHFQDEPAIRQRIDERVNDYLLDSIYQGEIVQGAEVTEEDMRAAYRRQAVLFTKVHSVDVQYLVVPDSSSASTVLEHVRHAKRLKDAIMLSSPGMRVREESLRFPSSDPAWSGLEYQLRTLPAGSYGGPAEGHGGWIVYQLVARDETVTPIESLPIDVQQGLSSEAQGAAVERRLTHLTDSLRTRFPVQVDRQRLAALPWPPPGAPMPLGQIPQMP